MKVSMIGTGYVGLVSGTCFAELGHQVTCIDIDQRKIELLNDGGCPIYEPGLTDLIKKNVEAGRLSFSSTFESIQQAATVFLGVGTPSDDLGRADLKYLKSAAEDVAKNLSDGCVVVIKSTVPVGTGDMIEKLIAEKTNVPFHLVNNPEFLKEGSAVEDFMKPDRVVIGYRDEVAAEVMDELYAPLVRQGNPIYKMSNLSAEMTKYAANCFLATKISFINEIARLCDRTGADINEVRKGISSDKRIGPHFLYPGPGYGGSCFPKDVKALVATAKDHGIQLKIVDATEEVNEEQKVYVFEKIRSSVGDLAGKNIAFWGTAFKARTDDVRESSSLALARKLLDAGANVHYFDPVAMDNFLATMKEKSGEGLDRLIRHDEMYSTLEGVDALVTVTEWREFQAPDYDKMKSLMKAPVIVDGRNLYDTKVMKKHGFQYQAIGKRID